MSDPHPTQSRVPTEFSPNRYGAVLLPKAAHGAGSPTRLLFPTQGVWGSTAVIPTCTQHSQAHPCIGGFAHCSTTCLEASAPQPNEEPPQAATCRHTRSCRPISLSFHPLGSQVVEGIKNKKAFLPAPPALRAFRAASKLIYSKQIRPHEPTIRFQTTCGPSRQQLQNTTVSLRAEQLSKMSV